MKIADSLVKEQTSITKAHDYLARTRSVLARVDVGLVDRISELVWQTYKDSRTVFLFGNGGSAALASHLACDLAKGTVADGQRRLRAVSLVDNPALITAWANDSDYEEIFAEQLQNLIQRGDLVLAISASGNSRNVIRGLEVARQAGATLVSLSGFNGGKIKDMCDVCLVVPSDNMQHVEDAHLTVAHAIFSTTRERMLQAAGE